ncbi:methyltransferase family protein [Bythopirellula polymerisocia]|uniref:Isoprenylcysteine carboxyl methyltransferase (ICMT) family protein n=1 Tax=Bythopirellula polymerisocia TaxID=2528003 RepID=A0A5C6CKJ4_9BACT|nr:isoprenylcysteine carboxylmethyltransferase family protein [Bythopirellula polymerisocia]TWU24575.1 Isoprenylcysteine carboxyl methyltransferase (ICMT) family protein [Bythopirellula polymerisocia]
MGLRKELEVSGNWLFRFRSFVPLLFLIPFLVKMSSYHFPWGSNGLHEVMHIVSMAVVFSGLAIRALVAGYAPDGTSGRNTRQQVAQNINTTGLYSVVRHPLYVGNFLMWGGIVVFCLDAWLILVFCLGFWLYYERIMFAEESFLRQKFGEQFTQWAARTPAFLPRLSNWVAPSRPFSWRRVLRQEYTSFFLAVVALFGEEILEHLALDHRLVFEPEWVAFLGLGAIVYLVLRHLKKHTSLLTTAES